MNPDLVAVPPPVVTETSPVFPAPTTAAICVEDKTVKLVAAVPPNFTEVVPVKLVPVMVTINPETEEIGVNDEIVGG